MKILHILAWSAFLLVIFYNLYWGYEININEDKHFNLFHLSFSTDSGQALIQEWSHTTIKDGETLVDVAKRLTNWDFLFIYSYVSLLIILSYDRMIKETRWPLNNLLRFNFILAVLIAILDVTENFILLNDMKTYNIGNYFFPSYWFTLSKFLFGGWAVIVLLYSWAIPAKWRSLVPST